MPSYSIKNNNFIVNHVIVESFELAELIFGEGNVESMLLEIGSRFNIDANKWQRPQPFPSWILNEETYEWEAPTKQPEDGKTYTWDEATVSWSNSIVDQPSS